MGLGLFDTLTDEELLKVLRREAERKTVRRDDQWKLAEDFLENNQLERTDQELRRRYPTRQAQTIGEKIQAVTVPLMDRYVAEAADAYNKPVARALADDEGNVQDEPTEALRKMTDESGLDERLHMAERYTVAQDAKPVLVQAKRGLLNIHPVPIYQTHPVLPLDATRSDRSEQADYMGHVVELDQTDKDTREWVFITPAAQYHYTSEEWSEPVNAKMVPNNGYIWPQREMTEDDKEKIVDHPLQMLTWWHRYILSNKLLPVTDIPIAVMNLEINVQLSCLLDTVRKQGWSQLVSKVMDPSNPPQAVPMGTGFMLTIGLEEEIQSLSMANDYAGIVTFLQFLVKFLAVLLRQSANDFAIDATGPESGFAKLVDSLPKIEARNDRIRRLKTIEETVLWPRLGAVGRYLDKLPSDVDALHMRTKFGDVEFPLSVDERTKKEEHDIKHGYTTPAKILAERDGIPLEEAEQQIADNKGKQPAPEQQPGMAQPERRTIAQMVAARKGEIGNPKDKPEDA